MKDRALLIVDSSKNSDLFYGTNFVVGDPVIFIDRRDKRFLLLNDLEVDRGKKEATKVDEVISMSKYNSQINDNEDRMFQYIKLGLEDLGIKKLEVSDSFSAFYYKKLLEYGFDVDVKRSWAYPERIIKNKKQKDKIKYVMKELDNALIKVVDVLYNSSIEGKFLKYQGEFVTSEYLKQVVNIELLKKNIFSESIIIASGPQTVDPHDIGSGKIYANETIIIDIFPRSHDTLYFGDQTRTFLKGKASDAQKKLYNTVFEGQKIGIDMLKEGVNARDIHSSIMDYFVKNGYKTGLIDGRMQGFFHGTGHGVGLDIHEAPRISTVDYILQAGNVITIEPGLYYKDLGGVRIEDTLWVLKDGCENLSYSKKFFEID